MMPIKSLLLCITLASLTACGGGGGGGSSNASSSDSGSNTGGDTGGSTGGDTGGSTGGDTGGSTGGDTGSSTGGDTGGSTGSDSSKPNILLVISDDQGLDSSAQYSYSNDLPVTPTLNALAEDGLVFENSWVTPSCATTRAALLTGKFGHNTGVITTPGSLNASEEIIHEYLANNAASADYSSASFGKWHLGNAANTPNTVGVPHYAGNIPNVGNYFDWTLTVNGTQTNETEYNTSKVTDLAIDWIDDQDGPWFAWVAYSAPHSPFHLPPADLHTRNSLSGAASDITSNRREYYLAMIEALDTELGRLLSSLSDEERANTTIIFIGDNGTPANTRDTAVYNAGRTKGSLYEGGIGVPMMVSGKSVTRKNEREDNLVTGVDLFATIGQLAGIDASQVNDSVSFADVLTDSTAAGRSYSYTEYRDDGVLAWAIRNDEYKLIEDETGRQELYRIGNGIDESNDLAPSATGDVATIMTELSNLAAVQRGATTPDNSNAVDITDAILTNGSGNCADYVQSYTSSVMDVNNSQAFMGDLVVTVANGKCVFNTNAIPNHNFNDGTRSFPNDVSEQDDIYQVTTSPSPAASKTELSLRRDNALMLNGVKADVRAAACYGVGGGTLGSEKVGCGDNAGDWRYDPVYPGNGFGIDSHNAHAQGNGAYHYHGSPLALFDDSDTSKASPVIGFAADGYPIYGSYFDDNGTIRKATSSYALKSGTRPTGDGEPGESDGPFAGEIYNGRFIQDYEYVAGTGDLDECNGMTVNGVYGYYITDAFPYILGCFSGTPDDSFNK